MFIRILSKSLNLISYQSNIEGKFLQDIKNIYLLRNHKLDES